MQGIIFMHWKHSLAPNILLLLLWYYFSVDTDHSTVDVVFSCCIEFGQLVCLSVCLSDCLCKRYNNLFLSAGVWSGMSAKYLGGKIWTCYYYYYYVWNHLVSHGISVVFRRVFLNSRKKKMCMVKVKTQEFTNATLTCLLESSSPQGADSRSRLTGEWFKTNPNTLQHTPHSLPPTE